MKKVLVLFVFVFTAIILSACSRTTLYILNWGSYINPDVVDKFEKEYGVRVVVDTVESNETMYTKIKNRTTRYDLAVPSDYMIERLYQEGLLLELDFDKIPNFKSSELDPELRKLQDEYFGDIESYFVPYFFGTLGIMYNKSKSGVKELVEQYEWRVFFDRELIGKNVKVGMYNSSRDAIGIAALYKGYNINTSNSEELADIERLLSNMDYDRYETDFLKTLVAQGNLDIALVYSGDFFDELYNFLELDREVTIGMHVPNNNNIWFDAFVMPNTANNIDLAHKFLNFMCDVDVALENAIFVGYCPTSETVFNLLKEEEEYKEIIENYPYHPIADPEEFHGQIYRYLGPDVARTYDEIFQRSKAAR